MRSPRLVLATVLSRLRRLKGWKGSSPVEGTIMNGLKFTFRSPLLTRCVTSLVAASAIAVSAHADAKPVWFHQLSDVSIYTRLDSNLDGQWKQYLGLQLAILSWGNFSAQYSVAYDPTYAIRFDKKPAFTNGLQLKYIVHPDRYQPAVYTKPKCNFLGSWAEETGVTAHVVSYKKDYMSAAFAYVNKFPYKSDAKPGWAAYVAFVFPL